MGIERGEHHLLRAVEPVLEFLAGLEERNPFGLHLDGFPRPGVSPRVSGVRFDFEGTQPFTGQTVTDILRVR